MKIVQNKNEIFCNPSTPEDLEIVSHFSELKEIDTFTVSLRSLEENDTDYHYHAGMFHGWMLNLQASGKNVIVITRNKTIGGVFNYLDTIKI